MSRENVDMTRRAFEAFNRGDLEGMVADIAPNFEYLTTGAIPDRQGVYRGPEGWTEFAGWLGSEFESPRIAIQELIEAGDQVLTGVTLRGRGKQSGVEASWDLWVLWTFQDGKVVHGQGFTSRAEALEAAGLSE